MGREDGPGSESEGNAGYGGGGGNDSGGNDGGGGGLGRQDGPGSSSFGTAARSYADALASLGSKNEGSSFLSGIGSLFGINPNKGFLGNVADMAIPGRNTPFGALGLLAGPLGLGPISTAMTVANLASQLSPNTQTASNKSTVGQDAIAELAAASQGMGSLDKSLASRFTSAVTPVEFKSDDLFSNQNLYGNVSEDILRQIVNDKMGG